MLEGIAVLIGGKAIAEDLGIKLEKDHLRACVRRPEKAPRAATVV